jgi:hypothetical protein
MGCHAYCLDLLVELPGKFSCSLNYLCYAGAGDPARAAFQALLRPPPHVPQVLAGEQSSAPGQQDGNVVDEQVGPSKVLWLG